MWTYRNAVALALCASATILVGGCSEDPVVPIPEAQVSVRTRLDLGGGEWTVTVSNARGQASSRFFAVDDHRRSNLYLTPSHQLVMIEQGGEDAFFALQADGPPISLTGGRSNERDTASERWRYLGVIDGGVFRPDATECIALLGEGRSPYRKAYQRPHFC